MYFGDTCDRNQNCVYWGDTSQITIKIMDHNQYHKYNYLRHISNHHKIMLSKHKHVFWRHM
jgi:hypothetical protein